MTAEIKQFGNPAKDQLAQICEEFRSLNLFSTGLSELSNGLSAFLESRRHDEQARSTVFDQTIRLLSDQYEVFVISRFLEKIIPLDVFTEEQLIQIHSLAEQHYKQAEQDVDQVSTDLRGQIMRLLAILSKNFSELEKDVRIEVLLQTAESQEHFAIRAHALEAVILLSPYLPGKTRQQALARISKINFDNPLFQDAQDRAIIALQSKKVNNKPKSK